MKRLWLFVIIVLLHDTRVTTTDCEKYEVKLYPNGEEEYIDPNCRCYRTRTVYRINYSYLTCANLILRPEQGLVAESIEGNLKFITVVNSHIGIIPSGTLRNYNTLQELYFNNTGVSKIHGGAFAGLISLRILYLQENGITKLADGLFGPLNNLEILNASHNAIETIEEEAFFGLINLLSVDLSHNNLKRFSETVFYKTRLEFADLSFNSILSLPEKLIDEANDTLNINFSYNNLTSVNFKVFPINLQGLSLTNNFIADISNLEHLENVENLDLSNNYLEHVRAPLRSLTLQNINMSHNKLSSIKNATFKLCEALSILDLSYNIIDSLDEDALAGLTSLQELRLAYNSLKFLPVACFRDLNLLIKLTLSFNNISDVAYGNFVGLKQLQRLDISGNRLTFLNEDTFFELQSLLSLNISYNNLSTFDSSDIKEHLPNLQILDLRENPWICKSLLEIVKTLEKSGINIVEGTTLKFNILKGKCYNGSNDSDRTVQKSNTNNKESTNIQDLHNLIDNAVKVSFIKYFQNFTENQLDLNKPAKLFLDNFNSGFRNTTFYQYFSSNYSKLLNKSIVFTNVKDDLKNLDTVLRNLSLNGLTDKLHKLINSDFKESDFYKFFEKGANNSQFFKMFSFQSNANFKEMKKILDANYNESSFFKFFSLTLNQLNSTISKLQNVDDSISQKLLNAITKLSNTTNQNFLQPQSDFLSNYKDDDHKLVILNIVLIIVIVIGFVFTIFHNRLNGYLPKRKLLYFNEGSSSTRISRADMEMS